jgi:hypothetical protein
MQKEFEVISLDNGSWGVVIDEGTDYTDTDYIISRTSIKPIIPKEKSLTRSMLMEGAWTKIIATIGKRLVGLPLVVIRGDNEIPEEVKAKAADSLYELSDSVDAHSYIVGHRDGYKAALQDKKYSEEDIKRAIDDTVNQVHYSYLHPELYPPIEHNEWREKWILENPPTHNPGLPKRVKIEYEDAIKKGKYGMVICKNCKIVTQPSPEGEIIIPVEVYY